MAASWWLKVKRAQKHMAEIDRAARLYAYISMLLAILSTRKILRLMERYVRKF